VRLVVPIAPGGANDIIARLIAERLAPVLGQPVVVENRPGAGGNLGAAAVAQAEKDGHTLLFTSANVLVANKWLYRTQMPIDPLRDLAPVTRVAVGTILLVANAQRPGAASTSSSPSPAPTPAGSPWARPAPAPSATCSWSG
jgi:tripartite-type tricarboxylate transporter receptor subunit TctC